MVAVVAVGAGDSGVLGLLLVPCSSLAPFNEKINYKAAKYLEEGGRKKGKKRGENSSGARINNCIACFPFQRCCCKAKCKPNHCGDTPGEA